MAQEIHQEPFMQSSLGVEGASGLLEGVVNEADTRVFNPEDLALFRAEFIDDTYPALFGDEEMGDVARSFTPEELTAVLVAYEHKLMHDGLLRVIDQQDEIETASAKSNAHIIAQMGSSGYLKVFPRRDDGEKSARSMQPSGAELTIEEAAEDQSVPPEEEEIFRQEDERVQNERLS